MSVLVLNEGLNLGTGCCLTPVDRVPGQHERPISEGGSMPNGGAWSRSQDSAPRSRLVNAARPADNPRTEPDRGSERGDAEPEADPEPRASDYRSETDRRDSSRVEPRESLAYTAGACARSVTSQEAGRPGSRLTSL